MSESNPDQNGSKPIGWMIASILSSVIALGVIPPLFGGLAIFFGYQAYKVDERLGQVCMTLGGLALIAGFVLGFLWGADNLNF